MNTETLVRDLRARGVTITVDGPDLVLRPKAAVPQDLIPEIQRHKSGIVTQLAAHRPCLCSSYRVNLALDCPNCQGAVCAHCRGCLTCARRTGDVSRAPTEPRHQSADELLARLRRGAAWLLDHHLRWQNSSPGAAGDALFGKGLHLWADLDDKLRAEYSFIGCVHGTGQRCADTAPVYCLDCANMVVEP